tara:strand:+ start:501 stop:779 length:279 start_codon:yes stop_codon:yes gene_type:complete
MDMSLKNKELPKWFDGEHYTDGDVVTNPFSGETYELNRTELSMYDFLMGCQFIIDMNGGSFNKDSISLQNDMRKGLDWFRKNNAKAYMVLLD